MVYRGSDKRWAQGQRHSAEEMMQFKRDQTLIVIHANYGVVITAGRLVKKAVGRKRTISSDPFAFDRLDRRDNGLSLLVAKDSFFATMGIQGGNRDPGMLDSKEISQALMGQL